MFNMSVKTQSGQGDERVNIQATMLSLARFSSNISFKPDASHIH